MKLTLSLAADERIALMRFANDTGESVEDSARMALRDWLIAHGYLELDHELDEDMETEGNA